MLLGTGRLSLLRKTPFERLPEDATKRERATQRQLAGILAVHQQYCRDEGTVDAELIEGSDALWRGVVRGARTTLPGKTLPENRQYFCLGRKRFLELMRVWRTIGPSWTFVK
jgi:hypothetical protein